MINILQIFNYQKKHDVNYRVSIIFRNIDRRVWNRNGRSPYYENVGIEDCWNTDIVSYNEALADFVLWAWTHGYDDNLTIDRIDNSKGYFKDNCRWVSMKVQQRNRTNNIPVTVNGIKYKTVSEAIECLNREKDRNTIISRIFIYKWSPDDAFNKPIVGRGKPIPVIINGIKYKSVAECCSAYGIKRHIIKYYMDKHNVSAEEAIKQCIKIKEEE